MLAAREDFARPFDYFLRSGSIAIHYQPSTIHLVAVLRAVCFASLRSVQIPTVSHAVALFSARLIPHSIFKLCYEFVERIWHPAPLSYLRGCR